MAERAGWIACADGSHTRAHPGHGQPYHSLSGAREEAEQRYVKGCRLAEQLGRGPAAVLDIGFGLGWNAAAALRLGLPGLHLYSFESDPAVLACAGRFPHPPEYAPAAALVRRMAAAPEATLPVPGGSARLLLGDARRRIADLPPLPPRAAVFLDPFSPAVAPELWTTDFLRALAARLPEQCLLATYSAATGVRLALLAAGFRIGRGPRVGSKASGTLASLAPALPLPGFRPRRARKLRRWFQQRIGGELPEGVVAEEGRN